MAFTALVAIILITFPLIGGFLSSIGMDRIWYNTIRKPSFTPPSWVFGPAWTILYILMGIASYLVWQKRVRDDANKYIYIALGLYAVQLLINWAWSPVFFGAHRPDISLGIIATMWVLIAICIVMFWRIRPLAGMLLLPYIAWVSFAFALNYQIYRLNT